MHHLKIVFIFFVFLFVAKDSIGQEKNYRFHKVFFYSFTKYIDWPEEKKKGDFVIAVIGDSEIIPLLEEMAEIKKVGERNIKIVKLDKVNKGEFYHIVFVPSEKAQNFASIKTNLNGQPCLLVTESEGMARNGSMINFKDVDGKLRFEVNTTTLEKSGLKMSQELTRFGEEIN
ncbi:YfiR family protein [Marivirga harenae]|uniref:YfiR family protein n=1 Tax=Marivirga harenae TaxID=2010992 RepID=UPI0026DFF454|nr:YfiR family protein [Marivirga harenae]WKV13170.1 YfiR family protein [Marivirga harenae]|tara:strand:+ start:332445 stop:332963 length:519 start_codon:yes stop_codon:yes gene_type:complete